MYCLLQSSVCRLLLTLTIYFVFQWSGQSKTHYFRLQSKGVSCRVSLGCDLYLKFKKVVIESHAVVKIST